MEIKLPRFIIICLWFLYNYQCLADQNPHNPCSSKTTCGECIQQLPCAWCSQPEEINRDVPRCFPLVAGQCPMKYTYCPQNMFMVLQDLTEVNQLSPSITKLELRAKAEYSLVLQYPHRTIEAEQSSSVELQDNSTSEVTIKYYSKCSNEEGPEIETNKCDNVKDGTSLKFRVQVKLNECPKDKKKQTQTIQVYAKGIGGESIIHLTMLCVCPCELPNSPFYMERAPQCSMAGNLKCGICECDAHYFGEKCQCRFEAFSHVNGCAPTPSGGICSGRGVCICGSCECDYRDNPLEVISGKHCECDNYSCERSGNKICGGPEQGTCECGKCICKPGWTGAACDEQV